MIRIPDSSIGDTRTCDWSKVSKEDLLKASRQHIDDVRQGLEFLVQLLRVAGRDHDRTKISDIDQFHADFRTGFRNKDWWVTHQKEERHHFNTPEFVHDDVNLVDVLEQIVDGVMAGMARSGEYRCEPVSSELLQKAYANTAKLLLREVIVDDRVLLPGYLRGYGCCYQDRCENVPLGSLGPDRASVPDYIPSDQREGWLAGYQVMAEELYGPDWKTAEFVWKPAMEIRKEDK